MPLVHIKYKSTISVDTLRRIIPIVNDTVAEQLCCGESKEGITVTPEMVKIRFSAASSIDSQMPDLFIEVEGRAFESRLGHQEEYALALGAAVAPLIPENITYGIWVKLLHAGWRAGSGTDK
jgi:hypothetical protein